MADTIKSTSDPSTHGQIVLNPDGSNVLSGGTLTVGGTVTVTAISDNHVTNTIEEASATVTYIGKENAGAVWSVLKIDTTSGTVFTYATIGNNPSQTSGYATAWTARASLTYGIYSLAF